MLQILGKCLPVKQVFPTNSGWDLLWPRSHSSNVSSYKGGNRTYFVKGESGGCMGSSLGSGAVLFHGHGGALGRTQSPCPSLHPEHPPLEPWHLGPLRLAGHRFGAKSRRTEVAERTSGSLSLGPACSFMVIEDRWTGRHRGQTLPLFGVRLPIQHHGFQGLPLLEVSLSHNWTSIITDLGFFSLISFHQAARFRAFWVKPGTSSSNRLKGNVRIWRK